MSGTGALLLAYLRMYVPFSPPVPCPSLALCSFFLFSPLCAYLSGEGLISSSDCLRLAGSRIERETTLVAFFSLSTFAFPFSLSIQLQSYNHHSRPICLLVS